MINKDFEVYKLKRELRRSGSEYEIKRAKKNTYGEPTNEEEVIGNIKGLYHETNEHVSIVTGETTQIRSKKVPSILCLYEDTAQLELMIGDIVMLNGKVMKVTGVVNIQEWNMIADISLEVVDSGVPV